MPTSPSIPTTDDLAAWIQEWLSRELKRPAEAIGMNSTFLQNGMDSVLAMMLVGDLEDRLTRRLPPTLAWDYPTPQSLAKFLAESHVPAAPAPAPEADDLLSRLDDLSEEEIDRLLAAG
ncbi:MAG: acyl carrier protein [Acidobacteriota bacterium]